MKTLVLTRRNIQKIAEMKSAINSVERAFAVHAKGKSQMPAKLYIDLPKENGDFRAMPTYSEDLKRCSIKWVNAHPDNRKRGLPAVMAVLILNDPATGFPLAIMDATLLTALRTGAAGGVAVKYLSCKNSQTLSLVGCGMQAMSQLEAIVTLRKITNICIWDNSVTAMKNFKRNCKQKKISLEMAKSLKACVQAADILVTTTPSRKPIIKKSWVKPGAHINAIGADAKGKQECEVQLVKSAKVVIDDWEQASHSGEINVPFKNKQITKKSVCADLGDVVVGKKRARVNDRQITLFDSTGLAIQDIAVADMIYQKAKKMNVGKWVDLVG